LVFKPSDSATCATGSSTSMTPCASGTGCCSGTVP
jgi:hypothetical protein